MDHKPISFSTFKAIKKMSLNDLNRFLYKITKAAWQQGIDEVVGNHKKDDVIVYDSDELLQIIQSVKGIGLKRVEQIVDVIYSGRTGEQRSEKGD